MAITRHALVSDQTAAEDHHTNKINSNLKAAFNIDRVSPPRSQVITLAHPSAMFSAEQLASAKSFMSEATRGGAKSSKSSKPPPSHQSKRSNTGQQKALPVTINARQSMGPNFKPLPRSSSPRPFPMIFEGALPPHLRKAKEVKDRRSKETSIDEGSARQFTLSGTSMAGPSNPIKVKDPETASTGLSHSVWAPKPLPAVKTSSLHPEEQAKMKADFENRLSKAGIIIQEERSRADTAIMPLAPRQYGVLQSATINEAWQSCSSATFNLEPVRTGVPHLSPELAQTSEHTSDKLKTGPVSADVLKSFNTAARLRPSHDGNHPARQTHPDEQADAYCTRCRDVTSPSHQGGLCLPCSTVDDRIDEANRLVTATSVSKARLPSLQASAPTFVPSMHVSPASDHSPAGTAVKQAVVVLEKQADTKRAQ